MSGLPDKLPAGFEAWLLNAFCVMGIAVFVMQFVDRFRRKPSFDVEIKELATKDSVAKIELAIPRFVTREELHSEVASLGEQLTLAEKELDRKRSVSIGTLHTALTDTKEQVAALAATGEIRTQQMAEMERKIDLMPERVIALLRAAPRRV